MSHSFDGKSNQSSNYNSSHRSQEKGFHDKQKKYEHSADQHHDKQGEDNTEEDTHDSNKNDKSGQATLQENITGYIKDASASAVETAQAAKEKVIDYSDEISENISGYIKEAPIKSVLIAAGLGLLIGSLLIKLY